MLNTVRHDGQGQGQGTDTHRPGRSRHRYSHGQVALLAAIALSLLHHVDHVLRAHYSGWPFSGDLTLFSASLLVYPLLVAAVFLARTMPWMAVGLVAVLLVAVQVPHMFVETPADQYSTWADGVSSVPHHLGRPNLLGIASAPLGVASVIASLSYRRSLPSP